MPVDLDNLPDVGVDILAVGAHPDDTELGVGGILAKFAQQGLTTGIVDLTHAEPTPLNDRYRSPDDYDADYADKRIAEAQCAAKELGLTARVTLDLPNRRLFDTFEARCELATVFRRWKPKVVLVMFGKTTMASPDHYQAQLIVEAAVFYSRLTKWESYMGNLPVHRPKNILYFPVRRASSLHPQGDTGLLSSFFVDTTEVIDKKRAAILCYKSQFQDQNKTGFVEYILERDKHFGRMVGVEYAEQLASPNPLKLADLSLFL